MSFFNSVGKWFQQAMTEAFGKGRSLPEEYTAKSVHFAVGAGAGTVIVQLGMSRCVSVAMHYAGAGVQTGLLVFDGTFEGAGPLVEGNRIYQYFSTTTQADKWHVYEIVCRQLVITLPPNSSVQVANYRITN